MSRTFFKNLATFVVGKRLTESEMAPRVALTELKTKFGDNFLKKHIFSKGKVVKVQKESFQSSTFRNAGFHYLPGRGADRFLYTVVYQDGKQTLVTIGKVSSGNPYEVMHASLADDVLDLRKMVVVVYQFDGHGTITETLPSGKVNIYDGEWGKIETLLLRLRTSIGLSVKTEKLAG